MPAAPVPPADLPTLRFGAFELRPTERRLLRDGVPVILGARAIDLLIALAHQRGRLLSKQQLLDIVWPDLVVEEANLHVQISALRKVLGPEVIATVPGRGYQFVAPLAAGDTAAPVSASSLIGRDAEVATLHAALDRHALVTITGTGGTGKTALARHVAQERQARQRHGVTWVDLLEITDPQTLPAQVARALELTLSEATATALAQSAAPLDLLLVLDNGEHIGEALAQLADALLAGAPQLRLLITSQAPLQLFGEHVLRLRGLAVPTLPCARDEALRHGAVALFVARAQDADRRFQLKDDNLTDVVTICRELDGSALGLQVAAALLARMPLAAVRLGLGQRLAWPDLPQAAGRSRGLRSALAWSLSLLDDLPRELFRRLAAFSGPADLRLLQQALADETLDSWALVDTLAVLVDRSLVAVSDSEPLRYQLLETPRALAAEALALQGDTARWRERVFVAVSARADTLMAEQWAQGEATSHRQRHKLPLPDVLAAFDGARAHDAARAVSLGQVLPIPPLASAWVAHAQVMQTLALAPGLSLQAQARAWFSAAVMLVHQRPGEAQEFAERAVAAFAGAGDRQGEYIALCLFAETVSTPTDMAGAAIDRAAAIEDPAWGPGCLSRRARAEGSVANLKGDRGGAIAAYRRAVALQQAAEIDSPAALISLADAELADGQIDSASRHLMAVIERLRDGRHDTALYGFAMPNLLAAALAREQLGLARRTAAEGWPQAARVGAEAWWADHLALLAALEGRPRTAASLLGLADGAYARASDKRQLLEVRHAERAALLAAGMLGESVVAQRRAAAADPVAAAGLREAALALHDLAD